MTLRLLQTDSELLENAGACIDGEWYHLPFWFRKVGDGIYEEYTYDKLPESLKERIRQAREILPPDSPKQKTNNT